MKKLLFSVASSAIFAASLATNVLANGNQNLEDLKPDPPRTPGMDEIFAPVNPSPAEPAVPYRPNPAAPERLPTREFPLPEISNETGGGGGGSDHWENRISPKLETSAPEEGGLKPDAE